MKKENDILNSDLIDFELFVVPSQNMDVVTEKGKSDKKILVCYENEQNDPELDALLKNILSAAKIDFEHQIFLIKSTPGTRHSFIALEKDWQLVDFISFGIPLKDFGINYQLNSYQPLEINGHRFLKVDALKQIQSNIKNKKALWSCLQEMYLK